jgi:hypothetical protein
MAGSSGNRQDNRQRGNAAQLLEKYKTLARDAQLAGDRVQTEYYLQYADHYFRVLEETRSRYEEQQAQRRPRRDEDEFESDSEGDGDEELTVDADSGDDEVEADGRQRGGRDHGRDRDRDRGRDRFERRERPQYRSNGPAQSDVQEVEAEADERISLGVLPPAIGISEAEEQQEAPKPRRRARKPRAEDGDEEVAPAA